MGKAAVLHIMRRTDGTLEWVGQNDPPDAISFSSRYVSNGGNAARADHRKLLSDAGAARVAGNTALADELEAQAASINVDPIFTTEGNDIIFEFVEPVGPVRYRFDGFDTLDNGEMNTNSMRYVRVA